MALMVQGRLFYSFSEGSSNTPPPWEETCRQRRLQQLLRVEQIPCTRAGILQEKIKGFQWLCGVQVDPFPSFPTPHLLCLGGAVV